MVPFIVVYIFNWVIFFIIIASLLRRVNFKKKTRPNTFLKQQLIIVITLSTLFGLGWGLGLLVTESIYNNKTVRDVIAALFVICTAFHGLFIFLMYCLRSKDARSVWKNILPGRNFSEFSLNHSVYGKSLSTRLQYQTKKSQSSTGVVALCTNTKKEEVEREKKLTAVQVYDDDAVIQETNLNTENDGQDTLRFYARKTKVYGPQFDVLNEAVEIPMIEYDRNLAPYNVTVKNEATAEKSFSDDKENEKKGWQEEENI